MRKMEQEEFNKLTFDISPKECSHIEVVRLYSLGTHTDYGCLKCGLQHTNEAVFAGLGLSNFK